MPLEVTAADGACGAIVSNIDLARPLDAKVIAELRRAWLEHHVLVFPEQDLAPADFIRFAQSFGAIGDDPYIAPEPGLAPIAAIQRGAGETGKIFADTWHADWTFMPRPPAGTCLYGITIPPHGGDTQFANEHKALDALPADLRQRIEGRTGLHSAKGGYANDGKYSAGKFGGAMRIKTSDDAHAVQGHPLIRRHPETGRPGLFIGSYVFAVEDMAEEESHALLLELRDWVDRPEFRYDHKWEAGMLVLWDNRSVLHRATGGFEGHDRLLHRLTVTDDTSCYL